MCLEQINTFYIVSTYQRDDTVNKIIGVFDHIASSESSCCIDLELLGLYMKLSHIINSAKATRIDKRYRNPWSYSGF